mgnify:CR=1 FL=1
MLAQNLSDQTTFDEIFSKEAELDTLLTLRRPQYIETQKTVGDRELELFMAPFSSDHTQGGVLVVIHDVTEQRRSEQLKREFVANVSHELRTPLAALIAELDLALQKERSGEHYRRAMGRALQDARRMTRLIDGLLNLAKADYRQEQIKMEEIRLDELLLDVRSLILRAHPDYRIELLFEQEEADDERMITVEGNLHLLTIAFTNLIENNCKYSGDRLSCVHISYWDQWAILRFSDAGVGMTEEELRNLFTLFYRGGQESMAEGHGIGMALARKIVQLHRGRIAVHSEAGQGTTFVVELPHV